MRRIHLVVAAIAAATGLATSMAPSAASAAHVPAASIAASVVAGPSLTTPKSRLAAAFHCTSNIATSPKKAVLLVHGTVATPAEDFSWNYNKTLPDHGYPYCTITIPDRALGDLQVNVEYVVHAIRRTYELSGKKIAIIGHSQGASLPAYALRIWPDLAPKVDDFISYAGAFENGTQAGNLVCAVPCATAFKQFTPGSTFLTALAQHPMPAGPSYTSFATRYDEVVFPQPAASRLIAPGARNYVVQDLCPLDVSEHLTIIAEKPLVQLTLDALANPGPGQLARVGKLRCGLDPRVLQSVPSLLTFGLGFLTTYPAQLTTTEPPLRPYWNAS